MLKQSNYREHIKNICILWIRIQHHSHTTGTAMDPVYCLAINLFLFFFCASPLHLFLLRIPVPAYGFSSISTFSSREYYFIIGNAKYPPNSKKLIWLLEKLFLLFVHGSRYFSYTRFGDVVNNNSYWVYVMSTSGIFKRAKHFYKYKS